MFANDEYIQNSNTIRYINHVVDFEIPYDIIDRIHGENNNGVENARWYKIGKAKYEKYRSKETRRRLLNSLKKDFYCITGNLERVLTKSGWMNCYEIKSEKAEELFASKNGIKDVAACIKLNPCEKEYYEVIMPELSSDDREQIKELLSFWGLEIWYQSLLLKCK